MTILTLSARRRPGFAPPAAWNARMSSSLRFRSTPASRSARMTSDRDTSRPSSFEYFHARTSSRSTRPGSHCAPTTIVPRAVIVDLFNSRDLTASTPFVAFLKSRAPAHTWHRSTAATLRVGGLSILLVVRTMTRACASRSCSCSSWSRAAVNAPAAKHLRAKDRSRARRRRRRLSCARATPARSLSLGLAASRTARTTRRPAFARRPSAAGTLGTKRQSALRMSAAARARTTLGASARASLTA